MCFIAANATGKAGIVLPPSTRLVPGRPAQRCSFVEDLNWPGPAPHKKPQRPVEVWAPGPIDSWEGEVPRME
jgi:hypothetical protein